jgi:putative membrane protein
MLSLVNNINGGLGWVMAVVIYGMIFNTAIGMFYSLGRRLSAKRPDKFRIIFITATLAGFVLSFLGFKSLIATVYPALGYLGVFLIIVLLIAWFRGHSRIEDEAERRDRISELVERRDNPKKRFTSKQRRQLRHLVRASNIENAELREAVRKELDEESDDDSHDASSDEKPSGDGDHLHRAIHPSLRLKRMVRSPAVNRVITPVGVRESCQRRRRIR